MAEAKAIPMARKDVDAETFVRTWQQSNSVAEFCSKTGMGKGSARTRAFLLRRLGVPLKFYERVRRPLDIESLKKLAKDSTK